MDNVNGFCNGLCLACVCTSTPMVATLFGKGCGLGAVLHCSMAVIAGRACSALQCCTCLYIGVGDFIWLKIVTRNDGHGYPR